MNDVKHQNIIVLIHDVIILFNILVLNVDINIKIGSLQAEIQIRFLN